MIGSVPGLIHFLESAPPPLLPKTKDFFCFHPKEIARQLSMIEFSHFIKIKPAECVNQAWTKKDKDVRAPNIVNYIKHSNLVPLVVASVILSYADCMDRAKAITNFIHVAEVRSVQIHSIIWSPTPFFFSLFLLGI